MKRGGERVADLRLQPYAPGDRAAVAGLIGDVLAEHGFASAMPGVLRDLDEAGGRGLTAYEGLWVAEREGAIVGTVAVRKKGERTGELKRLYVRADHRGHGLGQALYVHAEQFARAAGYETLAIDSSRRFARAHVLYESNGFALVARLDNDWEDNLYEKRICRV
jgi:GNAT superfamily N-acetyltransferase